MDAQEQSAHVTNVGSLAPLVLQGNEYPMKLLEAMADAVPSAVYVKDLDGRLLSANLGYSRSVGRPPETYLGKTVLDIHGDSPATRTIVENDRRILATGVAETLEEHTESPDGQRRTWLSTKQPLRDEAGRIVGLIGSSVEITERKAVEAQLQEKTRALEVLIHAGAALSSELDLERLVQILTDAGVEITGAKVGAFFHNIMDESGKKLHLYTLSGARREDFAGMGGVRPTHMLAPTFIQAGIVRSDDLLKDPRYGQMGPHHGMPAGHMPFRSYLAVPVVSRMGEVLGGLIFGHPEPGRFTERHEIKLKTLAAQAAISIDNARLFAEAQRANETLESRVREQTAQRNRVWEMSRDLVATMGFDGYLKTINPAWTALLGHDEATLLARDFSQQVHPDDIAGGAEALARLMAGEVVEHFEARLRHADGSWRWVSWTLVPDGENYYAVGRDVTADKERQAEMERTQDALRQAQKMDALGQLTGGVAHDFNNLLTPIMAGLEIVGRQTTDERSRRLIAGALQSAGRASTLVSRLLAFSRQQTLLPQALDPGALVEGMRDLIDRSLGPRIEVDLVMPPGLPAVLADPNQLELALLNLAVNARDAMPEGGRLTLTASEDSVVVRDVGQPGLAPGRYVRFTVTDTGCGMDPATLSRAAEPFFTTKAPGEGTGLGLSMVHGLAAQSGGQLVLESQPGEGTTATLWIPIAATEPAAAAAQGDLPGAPWRSLVLLVDDEDIVRETMAESLRSLGYQVVDVGTAARALELVRRGLKPDALVTDHVMPGMLGADLVEEMRRQMPGLVSLMITGYAHLPPERTRGLPVLAKPFRQSELATTLAGLLGAKSNVVSLRAAPRAAGA